ncbi:ficolin-1-like [Saccostrea echinata]|uniref:ficolin-1-like n=1 Tax=Saccostrea echinata TaxID=191078 RepID=UPI002A829171|nr:ficolin-1-like [Saccostrea echinata]
MTVDNGGWIVFQRRFDGSMDFYRNWENYTSGFGNPNSEFYLGNQILHEIVTNGSFELRIDLEEDTGEWRYAKYSHFSIGGPETFYTLSVTGYTGNANDSFSPHSEMKFSTYDMDNDIHIDSALNCAYVFQGAWWYAMCAVSNLNGLYGSDNQKGLFWYYWHNNHQHSIKSTQMMVRMTSK